MSNTTVENSKERFEKVAGLTGEKFGKMASELTDTTSVYMNTGRDYVKENPVKGIAIAAAVGVLAGSILSLAFRSRD